MKKMIVALLCLSILETTCVLAKKYERKVTIEVEVEKEEDVEQIKEGNFSVGSSQQVFPLFSFGQILVSKKDFLGSFSGAYEKGHNQHFGEVGPSFVYGISDKLTGAFSLPIATNWCADGAHSSGIQDMSVDFEYDLYSTATTTSTFGLSTSFGVTFPTGSTTKDPATGAGTCCFFLGVIARYVSVNWYLFNSYGTDISTMHDFSKDGNTFLYQCGIGKNIYARPGLTVDLLLELDGCYTTNGIVDGAIDPDSGGNTLTFGPSLFLATDRFTAQAGIAGYICQNLNGLQNKDRFMFAVNVGYKFNG